MRIIGGKDYYDSAMAFGQDPKDVFLRQRHDAEDLEIVSPLDCSLGDLRRTAIRIRKKGDIGYDDYHVVGNRTYRILPLRVWFAGKRYGGFVIKSAERYSSMNGETRFIWDFEEFRHELDGIGLEIMPRPRHDRYDFDAEGMKRHFEFEGQESHKDWLIENRRSIAIWVSDGTRREESSGWAFDTDGLKAIGFSRRLDAWTAFQELSMYVGGVLPRPANPTVELTTEKIMVQKHGFDEWTFRKRAVG